MARPHGKNLLGKEGGKDKHHWHDELKPRRFLKRKNAQGGPKSIAGTAYLAECPECPWRYSDLRHQNEPVRVYVEGDAKTAQCPNGHKWSCA